MILIVLHCFDFPSNINITNASAICANFSSIILKRYYKIIENNPDTQFLLHDYSSEFGLLRGFENDTLKNILFICVDLSQESLDLIKLSYPECQYQLTTQTECITNYPKYFTNALDISSTITSNTSSPIISLIIPIHNNYNYNYNYNNNGFDNGIDNNLSIILPDKLYLTNYIGASNLDALLSNKITHIINITDLIENYFENNIEHKFNYLKISIPDALHINITEYLSITNEFIENAIVNGGRVLVHCFAGKSRSASIVIGYIMKKQKMTFDQALQFVKNARPVIDPNLAFCAQLSLL